METERYHLTWEYQDPRMPGNWLSAFRDGTGDDITDQAATLKQWEESGEEPIRNVELHPRGKQTWWLNICPVCGERSEVGWCCRGCRVPDPGGPTGTTCQPCDQIEVEAINNA